VLFAGLDVCGPTPRNDYFNESKISLTPHIGPATGEAQDRIGTELASQIINCRLVLKLNSQGIH
jgi:D-3-phosphoglycerate dehydrogenase